MNRKNKHITLWVVLAIIIIMALWIAATYNSFVKKQENIKGQWAQVETQYQRRISLIPNLVETTKGYMQFESGLLQNITELRSRWMNAASVEDKVAASNEMDSALSRLLFVYENYPELKSIEAVRSLMDELSGTENRIAVERQRYNDAVKEYNVAITTFPNAIIAGISGYGTKEYYKSMQGAENAPNVNLT